MRNFLDNLFGFALIMLAPALLLLAWVFIFEPVILFIFKLF